MSKYFYTDGTSQFGPFTFDELKEKNISRETLVWYQGLDKWTPAEKVIELKDLFEFVPPPLIIKSTDQTVNQSKPNLQGQMPPKTWLVESILVTLFCCLPFGIAGIVYSSKIESLFYSGDIDAAKKASAEAGKWTKIGFWVGIGSIVLYCIGYGVLFAIGGLSAISNHGNF